MYRSYDSSDSTQDTARINVKENGRGNQEWRIQRNRQHRTYKTQDEDKHKNTTQKPKR